MLQGKHIVLGISGGIAAYKIPELIRLLIKQGAEVKVTTTAHALEFVTPLTLQTLSGHKVYSNVFAAINEHSTEHISLPEWADCMLIAPATANVLSKCAYGIADDALTTTFSAMCKPVVIAPAMNDKMYASEPTQEAMHTLAAREHIHMLDCDSGFLACGSMGKGRMQDILPILDAVEYALTPHDMAAHKFLLTAGPTQEKIDPVRFVSNYSTGKMGFELARECYMHGADVDIVAGPVQYSWQPPIFYPTDNHRLPTYTIHSVISANQMLQQAIALWPFATTAVLAAAVADFAPNATAEYKIKREKDDLILRLRPTADIAATLGKTKSSHQHLVGFALETHDERTHAKDKMERKNFDLIILNSLQDSGAGFGYDTNKVTLFFRQGEEKNYPLLSKRAVAQVIADAIVSLH